jgi:hypothetical protein
VASRTLPLCLLASLLSRNPCHSCVAKHRTPATMIVSNRRRGHSKLHYLNNQIKSNLTLSGAKKQRGHERSPSTERSHAHENEARKGRDAPSKYQVCTHLSRSANSGERITVGSGCGGSCDEFNGRNESGRSFIGASSAGKARLVSDVGGSRRQEPEPITKRARWDQFARDRGRFSH